jgi:uncharacterized RDD family membrane protein YckC
MTQNVDPDRDVTLQGYYAGITTRFGAFLVDVITVVLSYDLFVSATNLLVSTVSGRTFKLSELSVASWALLIAWGFFYCSYSVAADGRTLGMALLGLRVVRADGAPVDRRGAMIRVLALPLSFLVLGIGFLLILFRLDNRALHDLIGGTAVVYAWDARAARLRFLARQAEGQPAP